MAGSGSGGESSPAEDRATGSSSTTTATTTTTPTPSINRSDDDHNDHDTGASSVIPNEPPRSSIDLRWAALAEVYNTERDYIGDLELIRQVFVAPLQSERIIDEKTMYNIFSNIEVILGCNKEFFRCLCEVPLTRCPPSRRELAQSLTHVMNDKVFPNGTEQPTPEISIGPAFTTMSPYFKMYKVRAESRRLSLSLSLCFARSS